MVQKYQDLIVWQKSKDLIIEIYSETTNFKNFSFKDQLLRASLSISNNIAEGFGRRSKKEFIRFLKISLGSTFEVESMILIFTEINLINKENSIKILSSIKEIIKILISLITKIKV